MYISYNWLKDFIKLPAKIKPEEIAEKLTKHTVEVEGLDKQASKFEQVVVGKVLEVKKHPQADRLRLVSVDIKKKTLDIVCGAPNVAPNQLVPVALVGALLPNGLEIKEAEIRGQKSSGMICAEDELGLGKNHEGIIVLKESAKIGEPFARHLGLDDVVLEVDNKSLSNRPDLWSHYGLARELGAIFDLNLKPLEKLLDKFEFLPPAPGSLEVRVNEKELCPRYLALKLDNLEIKDSPDWLKKRLIAVGQRPINIIVDLTNYVMLELGQPLHAFNAEKIEKIVVRRASKNEVIETLDEKERFLTSDDLVITDGQKPIALAGIMGGKNSEIKPETRSIILESANFQAVNIRRSSQRLALRSESSMRFEKSLDPNLAPLGLRRFLTLLKEVCPDFKIASPLIDLNNADNREIKIFLDQEWLTKKIGQEIPVALITNLLKKLGFIVSESQGGALQVLVPSWRAAKDISSREDLAEEVLRLYGYDNIAPCLPVQTLNLPELNQERVLERKIKYLLAWKYSLVEVYNYSFISEDQLKKINIDFFNYLKLANPLNENQRLLRQTLIPGLVSNIKNNQQRPEGLGFFEFGNVFWPAAGNLKKEADGEQTLPHQEKFLTLALSEDGQDNFRRLKGLLANFLQTITSQRLEISFSPLDNPPGWADKQAVAKIMFLEKELGVVGLLSQAAKDNYNLKRALALAEINFSLLSNLISGHRDFRFQEIAKYPPLVRDLAFVIDAKIMYNDFKAELLSFNSLIKNVEIFDVYQGEKLPDNQKSLAFHVTYQSEEKTLTAAEVEVIQEKLISYLGKKFGAQLRNF